MQVRRASTVEVGSSADKDGRCEMPTNLEQGRTNGTPLEQRLHDRLLVVEQYIRGYEQAFASEVDKLELYHVQGVGSKIDDKRREQIRRYQTPDTANCDGLAQNADMALICRDVRGSVAKACRRAQIHAEITEFASGEQKNH